MNILFFYSSLQAGGAERTIALLSNYIARNGHTATVVTMDNRPSFYPLDPEVAHVRLNTAGNSKNVSEGVSRNIKSLKKVHDAFAKVKPDVVICFSPSSIFLSYFARGRSGYKLIGSERTNPFLVKRSFWNKNKKWISMLCDGFLFQTRGAQGYYPVATQRKSIVLPNSIIGEDFRALDMPWAERHDICAAGRMDANKCFDDILAAFSKIHSRFPEIYLDLYGDGPLRGELEKLAKMLGLLNAVTFHGRCEHMYKAYSQHKYFVMMSRVEGMPNVLMEAMASGCACVSARCDFGPYELIQDGINGFLVPVHDCDAMAERICALIENDKLGRKLSSSALRVRQTHDINRIGALFLGYVIGVE